MIIDDYMIVCVRDLNLIMASNVELKIDDVLTIINKHRLLQQAPQQPKKVMRINTTPMAMKAAPSDPSSDTKSTEGGAAVVCVVSNVDGISVNIRSPIFDDDGELNREIIDLLCFFKKRIYCL
jgi:hypothetical protein